ncbi:guanine nucleotide exchange factor MSS4 homolog [Hylaeus anthracinus]|uniref:guanine nucleotide exchange factor MSS4 homolog n=1 Tax=Hylaeus volcanicus TaxID=313075 RepID=UPI0023B80D4E|nr:guanine nucleotide exchange factor MSS4 homolog [Hylaeus volcanicus]XP_054013849.1 guanine nucleotide exchange factor MSS4 homolog [Hylaeus anthracinus]
MSTDTDISSLKDENDKNKLRVYCTFCPSKILNAGAGRLVNVEFKLPYVQRKGEGEADQQESITDYWLVEDMYTFENIGLSLTVDNIKYLACADCERGPVGWHDLSTKKSYIALSRVKHE